MEYNSYLKEGAMLRDNTYRIVKVLGQGGFGITYLAVHTSLNKRVAIKEFFPKTFCNRGEDTSQVKSTSPANAATVERLKTKFIKEAQHIARMSSPYIVKIVDIFEENDTVYYIMDYIEGQSISDMVKANGPMPEAQAVEYITKVGEALTYIHSQNMNHLDVKPANIMVRKSDNNPVLIDFGLSKQYDSDGNQTSTTPVGISHGYAPMEQYNDGGVKEFSPQTDLYSLAATLYYMLTGNVPPQAPRLIDEELSFPPTFPPALISAVSKAMSSSRRARHATVAEFIAGLTDDSATEIKPMRRTSRPRPKRVADAAALTARVADAAEQATDVHTPEAPPKPRVRPSQQIPRVRPSQHHIPRPEVEVEEPGDEKKSGKMLVICSAAAVALAVIIGVIFWATGGDDSSFDGIIEVSEYGRNWESPLGMSVYVGPAKVTIENGDTTRFMPHGKGKAIITDGKVTYTDEKGRKVEADISGSVYDGEFVDGKMEGETTYTLNNGDVFIGTFHDNKFKEGKYYPKGSDKYFEGSFKNMQTDKGEWTSIKRGSAANEMDSTMYR